VPVQVVDDALGVLAASQPGAQNDRVFDDDRVLTGELLDPTAQRMEADVGRLIERDGAFTGLRIDFVDHPALEQVV
jgi:hypothetical protein